MPFSDPMFSGPSILTMIHGIGLSGGALMGLAAALFYMHANPVGAGGTAGRSGAFANLSIFNAVMLWLAVLIGTYIIFPLYRATPPEGVTNLVQYPRAAILADSANAWLHTFAMEIKEHVPWIAAMLVTAVAFVAFRYRSRLLADAALRRMAMTMLIITFTLVSVAALLGTLINKFAPVE